MSAAQPADAPYLDYRLGGRAGQLQPGKHPARQAGAGGYALGCLPFWRSPDLRRIDVRRSIADPFGEVMVRQTEQRSSISVVLAADVSRSMRPHADRSCLQSIAAIADAAARSAMRAGDRFGVLAFDKTIRAERSLAPTRARSAALAAATALLQQPTASGAEGIASLAQHLPAARCLVLLVSDFLMPLDQVERALEQVSRHDLTPIVLRADGVSSLPQAGLVRLRDAETGRMRLLIARPALHRAWLAAEDSRRRALDAVFARHGRTAFHTRAPIDIAALSLHLVSG